MHGQTHVDVPRQAAYQVPLHTEIQSEPHQPVITQWNSFENPSNTAFNPPSSSSVMPNINSSNNPPAAVSQSNAPNNNSNIDDEPPSYKRAVLNDILRQQPAPSSSYKD